MGLVFNRWLNTFIAKSVSVPKSFSENHDLITFWERQKEKRLRTCKEGNRTTNNLLHVGVLQEFCSWPTMIYNLHIAEIFLTSNWCLGLTPSEAKSVKELSAVYSATLFVKKGLTRKFLRGTTTILWFIDGARIRCCLVQTFLISKKWCQNWEMAMWRI